jgi:hypothetical protein
LLEPGGTVLVELEAPRSGLRVGRVRLEDGERVSEWFAWAWVAADVLHEPARAAGLHVLERWCDEGRWFARLEAP